MNRQGRQPRTHTPNSIHHVMIRGNNRQRIFFDNDYFDYFLKILKESVEKLDHKIIAYCLMSNHAHLLIHIHETPLSVVMQKINYRYARWLNNKDKRIGHLFQGRYRALHVNDEEYLLNLCRYIHFNPVTANIVKTCDEYLWSSHRYYAKNNYPAWMDGNLMLTVIKNKTNFNYLDFMNEPINREKWKPALYITENGDMVHDDDALRNLKNIDVIPDKIISRHLSEEEVSNIVCQELNIQKSQLLGPSKNHRVVKKRILLAKYLLQYTDKNIMGVAKLFQRTHGTLSRQLNHFDLQPGKYFPVGLLKNIEEKLNRNTTEDRHT